MHHLIAGVDRMQTVEEPAGFDKNRTMSNTVFFSPLTGEADVPETNVRSVLQTSKQAHSEEEKQVNDNEKALSAITNSSCVKNAHGDPLAPVQNSDFYDITNPATPPFPETCSISLEGQNDLQFGQKIFPEDSAVENDASTCQDSDNPTNLPMEDPCSPCTTDSDCTMISELDAIELFSHLGAEVHEASTISGNPHKQTQHQDKGLKPLESCDKGNGSLTRDCPGSLDGFGETSLHLACRIGDVALVKALIQAGSNLNTKDNAGKV